MSKIILCRGIQGSGKTTWARQWVEEDSEHRIRINNDDIRNMLGVYWVPSREDIVAKIKHCIASNSMDKGYDIVVDNMNLNPKEVAFWKDVISVQNDAVEFFAQGGFTYEIEFKDFFDTPLQECIKRDSKRPNPIGEEVIRKTYERYKHIIEK